MPRTVMTTPPLLPPTTGQATVLLAEDEAIVRRLVAEVLRRAGYKVIETVDGAMALEAARQAREPIHLLISDVAMPTMSGLELARCIAQQHPQIRILLMSGYSDPRAIADLQDQHGLAYLRKPFAPKVLMQQVASLLAEAG